VLVVPCAARRPPGLPHRLVLAGADAGAGAGLAAPGVELTGYVTDERLDALLRGAAALVHPSLYEGFGIVLLEAMVRGCPVVAARASALPETAGEAAAFFDPGDAGHLARTLRSVLEDGTLRGRLVAVGGARAAEFSWERTARETAAVYRELV
jgi:glycosyltransferase involved in cell wall biosynthesis